MILWALGGGNELEIVSEKKVSIWSLGFVVTLKVEMRPAVFVVVMQDRCFVVQI